MCTIPYQMGQNLCWIKFDKKLTCYLVFNLLLLMSLLTNHVSTKPYTLHCIQMLMITSKLTGYYLCLLDEAAWSNTNVNFQIGANMVTLHSWLNTQLNKVSQFFIHILAHKFHFTHIYIPFILSLFNYIQTNDDVWCFGLIWFFC